MTAVSGKKKGIIILEKRFPEIFDKEKAVSGHHFQEPKRTKDILASDSSKVVISKYREKINEMTIYANRLKKNVMKANFGYDHKSMSQKTIKKTQL